MNEIETSPETTPVTVNMYPSVKEQVATSALVSVVSIAIPIAAIGLLSVGASALGKARTWNVNRKAAKEAKNSLWITPEAE